MIDTIIEDIIKREGGFVNHSNDRGGPTKYGITLSTLKQYKEDATVDDVKTLHKETARLIYRDLYIDKPGFSQIENQLLKELVIDSGVHSGTYRATIWLQEVAAVKADGIIGPITIEAVNSKELFIPYFNKRMLFLAQLITRDNKQAVFAHGWYNRLSEFLLKYQKPIYNNKLEKWLNNLLIFLEK